MAGEIDKLELERFNQLLDDIVLDAENSRNSKKSEKTFVNTVSVGHPELIGGKVGDKMIAKINEDGRIIIVYSSAAVCARACNINPTTARQRASKEWVDEKKMKWSYITDVEYNELIK